MSSVFNENKDNKNNNYFNGYLNQSGGTAIFCFNGTNQQFKGNPKIVLRRGSSQFGNEILFQFLIKEKVKEYNANSEHNVVEFYFSEEEGIKFLKDFLNFIEGKK